MERVKRGMSAFRLFNCPKKIQIDKAGPGKNIPNQIPAAGPAHNPPSIRYCVHVGINLEDINYLVQVIGVQNVHVRWSWFDGVALGRVLCK